MKKKRERKKIREINGTEKKKIKKRKELHRDF